MSTPEPPNTPPGWYPDSSTGRTRWWDGNAWTNTFQPAPSAPTAVYVVGAPSVGNAPATASLVLGIIGFVFMPIPFFIGWFLGGIPDLIAVNLGIVALNNDAARRHVGIPMAVVGLVLGGFSLLSGFIGAGSIW
jgi:hypothetical protein